MSVPDSPQVLKEVKSPSALHFLVPGGRWCLVWFSPLDINAESWGWVWQIALCAGVCNLWLVRHMPCCPRHPPLTSFLMPEKERWRSEFGQDVKMKGVFALSYHQWIFWKCNIRVIWVSGKVLLYCWGHLMRYLVSTLIKLCSCIGVIGCSLAMASLGGRWWNIRYVLLFLSFSVSSNALWGTSALLDG